LGRKWKAKGTEIATVAWKGSVDHPLVTLVFLKPHVFLPLLGRMYPSAAQSQSKRRGFLVQDTGLQEVLRHVDQKFIIRKCSRRHVISQRFTESPRETPFRAFNARPQVNACGWLGGQQQPASITNYTIEIKIEHRDVGIDSLLILGRLLPASNGGTPGNPGAMRPPPSVGPAPPAKAPPRLVGRWWCAGVVCVVPFVPSGTNPANVAAADPAPPPRLSGPAPFPAGPSIPDEGRAYSPEMRRLLLLDGV
jgi:hypothetical protein